MPNYIIAQNTPLALVLSLIILALAAWRLKRPAFSSLPWQSFGTAAGLFWGLLSAVLFTTYWTPYYRFFAPSWNRFLGPIAAVALYSLLGLLLRWAALRLPGAPAVSFCLLGGLESIPEHAIAIYRFDILQIPILRGSTPISIFLFAFFEYVLFWGLVLLLTLPIDRLIRRPAAPPSPQPERPDVSST